MTIAEFDNAQIAALQRLGPTPTLEDYVREEVALAVDAPDGADWEPMMQLRMRLIDREASQ